MKLNQIAVTLSSEQDVEKLSGAIRGEFQDQSPQTASDDFIIAVLMGWHFRELGRERARSAKYVFTEFAFRRAIAAGATQIDEYDAIRWPNLGTPSSGGNILTVDGIGPNTYSQVKERVADVAQIIDTLETMDSALAPEDDDEHIRKFVAGLSGQNIFDYFVWAFLDLPKAQSFDYPQSFFDEMRTRGQSVV